MSGDDVTVTKLAFRLARTAGLLDKIRAEIADCRETGRAPDAVTLDVWRIALDGLVHEIKTDPTAGRYVHLWAKGGSV
jgi:hypothetical protein